MSIFPRVILFITLLASPVFAHSLSNPNANSETVNLYNYLKNLPSGASDRVLSGAFGGYSGISDENAFSMAESDDIYAWTGQRPAIYACDYARGWDTAINISELIDYACNNTLIDLYNQGGLVQISNHLPSPVPSNGGGLNDTITDADYEKILTNGDPIRGRWLQILDKVAEGLQQLEDAGVTVIYRPLHEMNGEWFWWGNTSYQGDHPTRRQLYRDLYVDMFNYFTYTKSLDNLIWVYSPDALRNFKTSFYPGSSYVDIVGLDAYTEGAGNSNIASGYTELLGLNKPFAFAEVGPDQATLGSYDYADFIQNIASNYPEAIYFIPWNNVWSPTRNLHPWSLFNHDWTINLGEVDIPTATTTTVLYDFESGVNGWTSGANISGGPWDVTEWAHGGSRSLKADVSLSADEVYGVQVTKTQDLSALSGTSIKVRVRHAEWGVWEGAAARLFIKAGASWTWVDSGWQSINSSNDATELYIGTHNIADLSDVREIGVEFKAGSSASGSSAIYLDHLTAE